jgi:hypothetical protein
MAFLAIAADFLVAVTAERAIVFLRANSTTFHDLRIENKMDKKP